jgi:hypothetical protein
MRPPTVKVFTSRDDHRILVYFCPGCEARHALTLPPNRNEQGAQWNWDGNKVKPTITPSVNCPGRCHATITNGQITFLADSTHKLAGQTVPLPPIHESD